MKKVTLVCLLAIAFSQIGFAQTRNITVQVDKPGAQIPKTLVGLFFEDINFGADGGLYPERVKNRSFEFPNPMMGWKELDRGEPKGQLYVFDSGSVNDTPNSHYLRIKTPASGKSSGVTNEGFRGIGVEKGADFTFSIMARRVAGSPTSLRVEVEDDLRVLGQTQVAGLTGDWKTYTATLRATETSRKARLNLMAGKNIDYLAIHHYYGRREAAGDPSNLMARPLFFERFYREVDKLLRELTPDRHIKLAINEWGLDLPTERQYSLESALYAARLMNVFERSGDVVEMSAVSDLVNGWPGGIIQAGRQGVFVSPIFLVNQLYNEHRGDVRVAATVDSPTFQSSREGGNVPYLDAAVSRASDGRKIFIKAVNTSPTGSLITTVNLRGVNSETRVEVKTITARSLEDFNDWSRPNAVFIQKRTITAGRRVVIALPKHSVSVITINTR